MRGRLKSTIYARMEEMSFRSGAAVSAGVLAAAGVAITLAVVPGGPSAPETSAAATSAPSPGPAARSVASPSPAPAPTSPSAAPRASRTPSAIAAGSYQPPSPVTAVTTPQAPASPAAAFATPRSLPQRADAPSGEGQPPPWSLPSGWDSATPGQREPGSGRQSQRQDPGRHGDATAGLPRAGE